VGDVFLGKFNKDDDDVQGNCRANYSFRSTMRTQEVYVESAQISVGPVSVSIKRGTKAPYAFSASIEPGKDRLLVDRANNFIFRSRYEQLSDSKLSGPQRSALLRTFFMLESSQKHIERILRETLYLGPFRQSPLRRYPFRGMSAAEVGPQGEATITMLAGEYVQAQDRPHVKQINTWLTAMNLAKNVDLARVGTSDLFDVKLTLPDGNKLPIADLGYGLSQVLPVLTQCTFAPQSSTLLFEQPELHLHENAAKKLAGVFHETAKKKQAHIVLETHSKELVYEFLQLLKTKKLAVEDLAIYMVQRKDGASNYKRVGLELDEAGNLEVSDPWVKALTEH